jgi:hypothetical protein
MKTRRSFLRRTFTLASLLVFPLLGEHEIVIFPNDDPLLADLAVDRRQLARALVSYCPGNLLQRLSGGRKVPAASASDEEVWFFLNSTGVLPAMSDGLNYPEDTVTRSHMAILLQRIIRMLSPGASPAGSIQVPADIDPSRYDALPILEVLSHGIMRTDSLGRFSPDSPLSGRDAIESILSLRKFSRGR